MIDRRSHRSAHVPRHLLTPRAPHERVVEDEVLLEQAVHGDRAAWEQLVRRHAARVWAGVSVSGLDGETAEQVSATVWNRLAQQAPGGLGPAGVRQWLVEETARETLRALRVAELQTRKERSAATADSASR